MVIRRKPNVIWMKINAYESYKGVTSAKMAITRDHHRGLISGYSVNLRE